MRKDTSEVLADHEDELRHDLPRTGPAVLDFLRNAQLEVSSIQRGQGVSSGERPWLLRVRPPEHIVQAFDLAPEILVLLVPGARAQARDIEQAEAALAKGLRLDRSLVLVISVDVDARDLLDQVVRETQRQYLFISMDDVHGVEDPQQWLRRFLRDQLGSADLFAPGPPVVGWDFFGRTEELERLRQHIVAGHPIGLYGLRKIGKTSLVLKEINRLADETRTMRIAAGKAAEETLALHIDMQALGPMEQNLAGFMRGFAKALFYSLELSHVPPKMLKVEPDWGKPQKLRRFPDDRMVQIGQELIESAIDWAHRGGCRRIVVFIDEYERLFNREIFPIRDSLAILEYLRGLVQTHPKKFTFIIAGLSRRYASQSMIGRRQNPLFNFLVDFPLAGLRKEELRTLLKKIGSRLGLRFDAGAVEEIWEQTGGHPSLARAYGRVIDQSIDRESRIDGAKVDRAMVVNHYYEYARQVDMTMSGIAAEISEMDRRCPQVLRGIASRPEAAISDLRPLSPEVLEQLCRLGVLARDMNGERWNVAMKSFGTWLIANYPNMQDSLAG